MLDVSHQKSGIQQSLMIVMSNISSLLVQALLNNSHLFHSAKEDFVKRGIDCGGVSLNLPNMMKQKEDAVTALTTGIGMLFKKNKVQGSSDYKTDL